MTARLGTWWYNFGWSDWVGYVDGWIPRFSLLVPILGYLILFNDTIGNAIQFKTLITNQIEPFGLDGQQRLRLVYFGLIALGVSNFIYRVRRPYVFKFGTSRTDYTRTRLEAFTFQDFLGIHHSIRSEGHLTLDGKYYYSEWEGSWSWQRIPARGQNTSSATGIGAAHVGSTAVS